MFGSVIIREYRISKFCAMIASAAARPALKTILARRLVSKEARCVSEISDDVADLVDVSNVVFCARGQRMPKWNVRSDLTNHSSMSSRAKPTGVLCQESNIYFVANLDENRSRGAPSKDIQRQ